MIARLIFLSILVIGATVRADDCFYCARLDKLQADIIKIKPDPLDEKTGLKQSGMVDEGIDITEAILKKSGKDLAQKDLERIVTLLAELTPYDAPNIIGQALEAPLAPHMKRFESEVRRQDAAGLIKKDASIMLRRNLITAEAVAKHGNAGDAEEPAAETPPAPAKKAAPKKTGK